MERHRFTADDRVRIDIPDETDPDHDRYHGEHGRLVAVLDEDSDVDDNQSSTRYRVRLESGELKAFSRRDLRPPITD